MKKNLALLLSIMMILSCAACATQKEPGSDPSTGKPTTSEQPNIDNPSQEPNTEISVNSGNIDEQLVSFLEKESNYSDKNYVFSPLSFKYAVTLATYGANGQTQTELLAAMGYKNLDENTKWAKNINDYFKRFADDAQKDLEYKQKFLDDLTEVDRKLVIGNSIWHNTDQLGKIKDSYIQYVKENFNAEAYNEKGADLKDKINSWVSDKTNKLIPSLFSQPIDERNTILINTLYLKSPWSSSFSKNNTYKDKFQGLNGTRDVDYMKQTDTFQYYNDKNTTMVQLALEGDLTCVFVMGDATDIISKMKDSKAQKMYLSIPKFEIESSFDQRELVNFLKQQNATMAFNANEADFSNLIDDVAVYIEDIVQKAKIITDEGGIEAAAVTAIMMDMTSAIDPEKPIEVKFDKPFKFFIYTENNELLFCGNYYNVE